MGRVWATVRRRWAEVPVWARWVLAIYMIGFAEGTGDHVVWMTHGGIHAYARFGSVFIQVFLVALIVLDPLVVVLAGQVRREAVYLAVAVMALDITANWIANWPQVPWTFIVDGVFVFATAMPLLRVMPAGPLGSNRGPTQAPATGPSHRTGPSPEPVTRTVSHSRCRAKALG